MRIFVVIFDTLRKDHTGQTYGNDWIKTPSVDSFAKDCIVFDKAYPESLATIPVRRAIHTGIRTFPFNHKRPELRTDDIVHLNGWDPIPPHHRHLSEYLKSEAFLTSFITSTYHQFKPNMNFHLGYDQWNWIRGHEDDKYRVRMRNGKAEMKQLLKLHIVKKNAVIKLLQKRVLKAHFSNVKERKSEEDYFPAKTFKKAIEFVKDTLDLKKVFCLIDEFDPHEPWDPPQKYLDLYVEKGYTGIKMITPAYMESVDYLTDEELKFMRASYAGEVSLCDNWFGYFVNELKELEIYDDSLIIFISDHGHSIGEHNATGKLPMFMYPELVDLPFMIKPPGGINGPKRIRKPYVYNFDILPTIFGFLNKDKPKALEGIDLSIFVDEEDQNLDGRNYITCGFDVCTLYKDDNYALITSNNRKHQKLYDLKNDPEWNINIANENPEICDDAFEKINLDAKGDLPLVSRFEFESLKDWYLQKHTFSDKG